LHARSLEFLHPDDSRLVTLKSELTS
jgi:hypothetical protein